AVRQGFGADKAVINRLRAEGIRYDPTLWRVLPSDPFHGKMVRPSVEEWARAVALAYRYRGEPSRKYNDGVPYHAVSAQNSVLYLNLPFDLITWHGNGANNDYLGFAWDGNTLKEAPNARDVATDLAYVVNLARSEEHPVEKLTCH